MFTSNFDAIAILEYQTYKGKWSHGIDSRLVTLWAPRSHSKNNLKKMIMCLLITFSLFMLCQKFKRLEKPQTLLKKPTFLKILIYQVSIKKPWPFVGVKVKVGLNMKIFILINQKMEWAQQLWDLWLEFDNFSLIDITNYTHM